MDRIQFIKGSPDHGYVVPVGNFAAYYLSLKAKAMEIITVMEVHDGFRVLGVGHHNPIQDFCSPERDTPRQPFVPIQ